MELEKMARDPATPGVDLGPADRGLEGAYRRGYYQAVAEIAHRLQFGSPLNARALTGWIENEGMNWCRNTPLDRHVLPPEFESE